MARQLCLLRHAEAEPHGTRPDFERRLTERGERQARLAGLALASMEVEIATVLTSPKERALRTAALALAAWDERSSGGHGELAVHDPLQQGFDGQQALALLEALPSHGKLLVVGHEPDFSGVVAELTGARIDLKKAGLAVVKVEGAKSLAHGANGSQDTAAGANGSQDTAAGANGSRDAVDAADGSHDTADGANGSQGAADAGDGSRSAAAAGKLVLLLRPAELALIASGALAEV